MGSSKTLLRSIAAVLSGRTLIRIIGIIFTPILVRLISQEGYGKYAVIVAVFSVTTLIARGGLFSSVRKYIAENHTNRNEQSRLVATGLVLSIIYALAASAAVLALFAIGLLNLPTSILVLLIVSLALRTPYEVFRSAFYGRQQENISEKFDVFRKVIYAVLALGLVWLGYGVVGVFIGYATAYLVVVPIIGWFVKLEFDVVENISIDVIKPRLRQMIQFGGLQMGGAVAALLLYRTDVFLIDFFKGSTQTAVYQAALVPAELVWFVPSAIQAALLQDVASSWADRNINHINRTLHSSLKYAALALLLLGVGLFGLAEEFLAVYFGPSYTNAATALRILLFGTLFYGLNRIYVSILQATGRIKYDAAITVLALLINIVLNIILIPQYGIVGAATGTAISYMFVFIGSITVLRFTEISPYNRKIAIKVLLVGGLFAIIYLTAIRVVSMGNIPSLIAFPVLGGLLFIGLTVVTGLVSSKRIMELIGSDTEDTIT